MASDDIFGFLNDVWDLLPGEDRTRFGELWKAYEQSYGAVWMKIMDSTLASSIDHIPLYNNQRWLKHLFDATTEVDRAATFTTNQDVSQGINLSLRYLVKFSVDGGTPVEVDLRGANPASTSGADIVAKINQAAGFALSKLINGNALIYFKSSITGPTSNITFHPVSVFAADASPLVLGIDSLDLPVSFPKFPYSYQLLDGRIVSIPALRNTIHDELVTINLLENVDYSIEFGSGVISFMSIPPGAMWAKDNQTNLETPYNNFGYLLDIYDKNSPAYLKSVKGLWFAFWTGPRPENIKRSLYLLFGLPTASQAGTVTGITPTSVTLTYTDATTETFQIPSGLLAIVALDQVVTRFQPLVSGINVFDKVNSPGFVDREVGRFGVQPFLTENATRGSSPDTDESKALLMVEENSYLPQIDVNAFISPDIKLANVRTFLKNIQPKSRTFLFQVLIGTFRDILVFGERLGQDIVFTVNPNLDYNPSLEITQSDRVDTETGLITDNNLDSELFALRDALDLDVYHDISTIPVLVDSFSVEG